MSRSHLDKLAGLLSSVVACDAATADLFNSAITASYLMAHRRRA
jgi:hypothetical protein